MDKQSGTKFVLALVVLGALKVAYAIIKQFIKVTARVIVYFGLYIPFFYLIVGSVLVGMGFFSFEVLDINSTMFYIGLGLGVACSVIITVKSYAKKPLSSVTDGVREEIREARRAQRPKTAKKKEDPILFVYHSKDHPELLIEEHADKFVVYYDDGVNPIKLLRVEAKNQ